MECGLKIEMQNVKFHGPPVSFLLSYFIFYSLIYFYLFVIIIFIVFIDFFVLGSGVAPGDGNTTVSPVWRVIETFQVHSR